MSRIGTLALAGAFAVVCAATAFAQSAAPSRTRAEVKAEAARALAESHRLATAGDAFGPYAPPQSKSTRTREEREEQTLEARREGELSPAGDAGDVKAERVAMSAPSTRTRAERKSETRAAANARQLTPAGEGQDTPRR